MIKLINNEDYRIFPLRAGKLLAHSEAYSYLLLLFKTDYETGRSNVLLETLARETGFSEATVSSHLHRAQELGLVDITRQYIKPDRGAPKTKNFYQVYFPQKDFIIVDRSFLGLRIPLAELKQETALKGFLLQLKCLCLNNCNLTYYSLHEMAKVLKISYGTIQKYMSLAIAYGLVERLDGAYRVLPPCFDRGNTGYFPKGTQQLYKDIYNSIDLFCQTRGLPTPPYKAELVGQLAVRYPYTERELEECSDAGIITRYSLRHQLATRLATMQQPAQSLNYFVKALTGKDYDIPAPKKKGEFRLDA